MKELEMRASLLRIKECDLRMDCLLQCDTSIDRGIHVGGAFSALTALTALYYGGVMQYNVAEPTSLDQDMFVLSKGHAVAALASVYADVGYIPRSALQNSRGYGALIKGHPGPIVPGVPVATGPLGHGISISCGYAMRRKEAGKGNVYCMVGDGELQEGSCWEGALLAGSRKMSNLCVIVDENHGQSDNTKALVVSLDNVGDKFRGFGFRVLEADSSDMASVLAALREFVDCPVPMPTAIVCHTRKGFGGTLPITGLHKAAMSKDDVAAEKQYHQAYRDELVAALCPECKEELSALASGMGMELSWNEDGKAECRRVFSGQLSAKAPVRNKKLQYQPEKLPVLDADRTYNTYAIAKAAMAAFAEDKNLYTIDSDLANASGLFDGTALTNPTNAINVGIAECNMMCVAEALASEGCNVWASTFSPFFDQRAMRRIAVSYQERSEAIEDPNGWLTEGHNLDITFLATSANLEGGVNGATHIGNDDANLMDQIAHVKVIDVGCPQMLLSVMKWIAEGNRGLVYLRTMKTPVKPLYPKDFVFTYGKAYYAFQSDAPKAVLVSSGHGVYEAVAAAKLLAEQGIAVDVIDMPSFDVDMAKKLAACGLPVIFAEQNNGVLADRFSRCMMQEKVSFDASLIHTVNVRDCNDELQFIQSGTYPQLIEATGLTPAALTETVKEILV